MIKTILFDVDGTLIDTEQIILESLQDTLETELNLNIHDLDLKFALGIPGKVALKEFIHSEKDIDRIHAIWSQKLNDITDRALLFDQITELLEYLHSKNYTLGIVTSKVSSDMADELTRLDLEKYFDVVITADDTIKHKPHPEPILKAIDELNTHPKEAVYIGDSIYDYQCAQNSEVQFALAKWGAQLHPEFDEVEWVLEKPKDLLSFLDNEHS